MQIKMSSRSDPFDALLNAMADQYRRDLAQQQEEEMRTSRYARFLERHSKPRVRGDAPATEKAPSLNAASLIPQKDEGGGVVQEAEEEPMDAFSPEYDPSRAVTAVGSHGPASLSSRRDGEGSQQKKNRTVEGIAGVSTAKKDQRSTDASSFALFASQQRHQHEHTVTTALLHGDILLLRSAEGPRSSPMSVTSAAPSSTAIPASSLSFTDVKKAYEALLGDAKSNPTKVGEVKEKQGLSAESTLALPPPPPVAASRRLDFESDSSSNSNSSSSSTASSRSASCALRGSATTHRHHHQVEATVDATVPSPPSTTASMFATAEGEGTATALLSATATFRDPMGALALAGARGVCETDEDEEEDADRFRVAEGSPFRVVSVTIADDDDDDSDQAAGQQPALDVVAATTLAATSPQPIAPPLDTHLDDIHKAQFGEGDEDGFVGIDQHVEVEKQQIDPIVDKRNASSKSKKANKKKRSASASRSSPSPACEHDIDRYNRMTRKAPLPKVGIVKRKQHEDTDALTPQQAAESVIVSRSEARKASIHARSLSSSSTLTHSAAEVGPKQPEKKAKRSASSSSEAKISTRSKSPEVNHARRSERGASSRPVTAVVPSSALAKRVGSMPSLGSSHKDHNSVAVDASTLHTTTGPSMRRGLDEASDPLDPRRLSRPPNPDAWLFSTDGSPSTFPTPEKPVDDKLMIAPEHNSPRGEEDEEHNTTSIAAAPSAVSTLGSPHRRLATRRSAAERQLIYDDNDEEGTTNAGNTQPLPQPSTTTAQHQTVSSSFSSPLHSTPIRHDSEEAGQCIAAFDDATLVEDKQKCTNTSTTSSSSDGGRHSELFFKLLMAKMKAAQNNGSQSSIPTHQPTASKEVPTVASPSPTPAVPSPSSSVAPAVDLSIPCAFRLSPAKGGGLVPNPHFNAAKNEEVTSRHAKDTTAATNSKRGGPLLTRHQKRRLVATSPSPSSSSLPTPRAVASVSSSNVPTAGGNVRPHHSPCASPVPKKGVDIAFPSPSPSLPPHPQHHGAFPPSMLLSSSTNIAVNTSQQRSVSASLSEGRSPSPSPQHLLHQQQHGSSPLNMSDYGNSGFPYEHTDLHLVNNTRQQHVMNTSSGHQHPPRSPNVSSVLMPRASSPSPSRPSPPNTALNALSPDNADETPRRRPTRTESECANSPEPSSAVASAWGGKGTGAMMDSPSPVKSTMPYRSDANAGDGGVVGGGRGYDSDGSFHSRRERSRSPSVRARGGVNGAAETDDEEDETYRAMLADFKPNILSPMLMGPYARGSSPPAQPLSPPPSTHEAMGVVAVDANQFGEERRADSPEPRPSGMGHAGDDRSLAGAVTASPLGNAHTMTKMASFGTRRSPSRRPFASTSPHTVKVLHTHTATASRSPSVSPDRSHNDGTLDAAASTTPPRRSPARARAHSPSSSPSPPPSSSSSAATIKWHTVLDTSSQADQNAHLHNMHTQQRATAAAHTTQWRASRDPLLLKAEREMVQSAISTFAHQSGCAFSNDCSTLSVASSSSSPCRCAPLTLLPQRNTLSPSKGGGAASLLPSSRCWPSNDSRCGVLPLPLRRLLVTPPTPPSSMHGSATFSHPSQQHQHHFMNNGRQQLPLGSSFAALLDDNEMVAWAARLDMFAELGFYDPSIM